MGSASLLCSVCFILGYLQFSSKKILADKNEVQGNYIKRSCEAGVESHGCRRSFCSATVLCVCRMGIVLHGQCCFLWFITAHWLCKTELTGYRAYGKCHPLMVSLAWRHGNYVAWTMLFPLLRYCPLALQNRTYGVSGVWQTTSQTGSPALWNNTYGLS